LEYKDIGPEVRHFSFEVPEVNALEFVPGQFVSLSDEVDGKKVTRAYSVASAPAGNRFELCLNRAGLGTFSPHLFTLKPGGLIPMKGPLGSFTLKEPLNDSIFVATGTGIAPFRAMLKDPRIWQSGKQCTLVFGVRYVDGILYRDEFEALAGEQSSFTFCPVVSRPESDWLGRTGHVQPHVLDIVGNRRDLDVYICGLKEMVTGVNDSLRELGFDKNQLVFEKYD
jgi:CDP-4-dehydro-6-deoxyglucose reductase, E3